MSELSPSPEALQVSPVAQAAGNLRPLGLGEILDRTFTLYRNNFWLFCGIMALPESLTILAGLLVGLGMRGAMRPLLTVPTPNAPPPDPSMVMSQFGSTFFVAMILNLVRGIIYVAAVSATTIAVASVYLGYASTIRDAYRKIRGRIWFVLGFFILLGLIAAAVYVVAAIVAIVGAAASAAALSIISPVLGVTLAVLFVLGIIVAAAWVLVRFSLALPVILLEDRGVVDAMSRSGILTEGYRGRIFLALLVMFLIALAITAEITVPSSILFFASAMKGTFMPTWLVIAQSLSEGIAGTVTGPLLAITIALLYYDMRIRKEAFDLEAMLAASPAPTPPPAAMPPVAPGPAPLVP